MSKMNENNKEQTESKTKNLFENKLFRKNAFKEENNLLPKSLLKDLIEDESSSESQSDSLINESSNFYPKNYDCLREGLENKSTNALTNYAPDENKLRASTFNENENARKGFKIGDSLGANTNNKLFKVNSSNEYQNFSRPKLNNNLNSASTMNLNTFNNNSNNNNNNNYFNGESRKFCNEQNYVAGKMSAVNMSNVNNIINTNNLNPQNIPAKLNTFNSLSRASLVTQSNTANNFHCNLGPQNNMNMRFNQMPGRNNFAQQNQNANFNCQTGCLGNNCYGNNCYSDMSPGNFGACSIGKNHMNQICLCPNCKDDSAFLDENQCSYFPNMNNINGNFNNNCVSNNSNMLGNGPQQHNNYMNFNHQQHNFDKGNINQCRTFCNPNVNHPNINLGNDDQKMLNQSNTISFNNQYHLHQGFFNNNAIGNRINNPNQPKMIGNLNNNNINYNTNPNMHNSNNYSNFNMNQLNNNINNLNLQDNLHNNENFRGIANNPKNSFLAKNLKDMSKQKDQINQNNNMLYAQQQENYNMQMCYNNIENFAYDNNNNSNIINFNNNKNNQINKDGYNYQNQFDNCNRNSKNNLPKKLIGNSIMHESFNDANLNLNFNSNNNNTSNVGLPNKNSISKKNSLNNKNNSGNNSNAKNSSTNVNNRDNINSSFTSASSAVNSQFEILDDENFDNFIERVGENLKFLIKNQKGSRSMQKFLDKIYPEHVNLLLARISGDLKEIMMDPYGNYFIQKLIQCSSSNQRMTILNTIYKDFIEIAMDSSGTHALQSLIEIMNLKEEEELIKSILNDDNILKLSINSNGTHIIQKIISCFDEENRSKVNGCVIENFSKLCMNANGICVIKRFINANKDFNLREQLINKFEKDCIEIVQDPFGNYAIQYAIDTFGYDSCKNIINEICVNILSLSMQKFSSNVVEKCIENCDDDTLRNLKEEIFNPVSFIALLKNKYGNFVLQRLVGKIKEEEKPRLKDVLIKSSNMCGTKEKTKLSQLMNFCK